MLKVGCILLSIALLLSVCVAGEEVDKRVLSQAGKHLKNFRDQYYAGFFLTLGGSVIAGLGYVMAVLNPSTPAVGFTLIVVGGTVSFVGSIITFLSYHQVGLAGEILEGAAQG